MNCNYCITKVIRYNYSNIFTFYQKYHSFQHIGRNRIKQNYFSSIQCLNERYRYYEKSICSSSQILQPSIQKNKDINFSLCLSSAKIHTNTGLHNNKDEIISKLQNDKKKSEEKSEKTLTLYQKFKSMYKRYWYVLIPVHVATSIVWYGTFFFAAKSGVDIVPLLEKMGTTERFLTYIRDSDAGYYGIAYAMYKIATPARYTVTLGGTTISINYLKNRGYIKPVPTKEELKVMYEDKKDELLEKREEFRGKYQEKKGEFFEKYHDKTDEMKEKYTERRKEFLDKYKLTKNKEDENEKR